MLDPPKQLQGEDNEQSVTCLQDDQADQSTNAESQDDRETVDSSEFVIQSHIGSGAQASVYRAVWWRKFGRSTSVITVAVKRLHTSSNNRVYDCECLTREISHPNLVKCFDATSSPPYLIVSEFCSGGSLYDLIHDSSVQFPWKQRLQILLDVSKGMEYLHNSVPIILHRDLKSCNVLLTKPVTSTQQRPNAKVADFGLSRIRVPRPEAVPMTRYVGTWRWMAPEVFSSTEYDERVDVFSFGIMMYEVLTRTVPYEDKWALDVPASARIGLHIIQGHRPNTQLVNPSCLPKTVELMSECWAGDPSTRPSFTAIKAQISNQLGLVTLYSQVKGGNF
jgi:serine/threonine protein kinase